MLYHFYASNRQIIWRMFALGCLSPVGAWADGGSIHFQGNVYETGCAYQPADGQNAGKLSQCRTQTAALTQVKQQTLPPQPYLPAWQAGGSQHSAAPAKWQVIYLTYR